MIVTYVFTVTRGFDFPFEQSKDQVPLSIFSGFLKGIILKYLTPLLSFSEYRRFFTSQKGRYWRVLMFLRVFNIFNIFKEF